MTLTLFQTLFGGAVAIVVLYALLRAAHVGNLWCGVIGGLVPLLGYAWLGLRHPPEADVASMHLAVYLATAAGLVATGRRRASVGRLHWAPTAIIAFFLVLFAIDGSLLLISGQGVPPALAGWLLPPPKGAGHQVHTAFAGVVPHGDEAAKAVNQYLASSDKQNRLGWRVNVSGLEHPREGQGEAVTVTVSGRDGQPVDGAGAALALLRPGQARAENVVSLSEAGVGVYRGNVTAKLPGLWVAAIRLERGGDRYETQRPITVAAAR